VEGLFAEEHSHEYGGCRAFGWNIPAADHAAYGRAHEVRVRHITVNIAAADAAAEKHFYDEVVTDLGWIATP
jgi:hypothetical protein